MKLAKTRHIIGKNVLCIVVMLVAVFSPLAFSAPTQANNISQVIALKAVYAQTTIGVGAAGTGATTGTAAGTGTTAATGTTTSPQPQPTSCTGWTNWLMGPLTCSARWTISVIAAAIIKIGVWILAIASGIFGILVERTIIGFGATDGLLTQNVVNGINTAWTALRDISNILIIGFFVFIAINIILGSNEDFGQKKLIARVIIVAILINFSLFFTKVIIDFSNYTATQFYNASIGRTTTLQTRTNGSASAAAATPNGIGDAFAAALGVTSFAQSYNAISQVGESQDSIASMILYAVASLAVLLGAAAVLLYGSFILASRAVLLVFLMITASLAFASHLLPDSYGNGKPGWAMWWRSLIESAVLAPILMLFLWATLAIAKALKTASAGGSLGDLIVHPAQTADLGALFSYLIILGLLFASFKVASSFSTSISGFNWASVIPAVGVAATARLAGFATQRTGAAAARGLNSAADRISSSQSRMALLGRGALYGAAAGAAALAGSRRGGGGPGGAVIANQVKGTGLNQKNMFPGRAGMSVGSQSATKAITEALKKAAGPGGGRAAIADKASEADKIKKEQQIRAEADKTAAETKKKDQEEIAKKIGEAAAKGGAANDNNATVAAVKEITEQNKAAIGEMAKQVTEAQTAGAAKLGEKFEHMGTEVKEAAASNREVLVDIKKAANDNASAALRGAETAAQREERELSAKIENRTSQNRMRYEQTQRTALAHEQTNKQIAEHLNEIKKQQATGNYGPLIRQETTSIPQSTTGETITPPSGAVSFVQPPSQRPITNNNTPFVDLVREKYQGPGKVVTRLRDNLPKPAPGTPASAPPHRNIPPMNT